MASSRRERTELGSSLGKGTPSRSEADISWFGLPLDVLPAARLGLSTQWVDPLPLDPWKDGYMSHNIWKIRLLTFQLEVTTMCKECGKRNHHSINFLHCPGTSWSWEVPTYQGSQDECPGVSGRQTAKAGGAGELGISWTAALPRCGWEWKWK